VTNIKAQGSSLPLYVAVNTGCNMKCWYCTEFDESRDTELGSLPFDELARLISLAHDAGFRCFRFTGGEPTLRRDLADILVFTQQMFVDVRIAITTNGTRLNGLFDRLSKLQEPAVFVSVDAIMPPAARQSFRIDKVLTHDLSQTIPRIRQVARVRINCVLTRGNAGDLPALIEYGEHAAPSVGFVRWNCVSTGFRMEASIGDLR
jgi:cyclic pyranopterin phosphate synthase